MLHIHTRGGGKKIEDAPMKLPYCVMMAKILRVLLTLTRRRELCTGRKEPHAGDTVMSVAVPSNLSAAGRKVSL